MLSKIRTNALSLATIAIMIAASVAYLFAGMAMTSGWDDRPSTVHAAGLATPTPAPTPCTPDDPSKPCPTPSPGGTPMPTPSPAMNR